jgi:DNA topoisomerase-2
MIMFEFRGKTRTATQSSYSGSILDNKARFVEEVCRGDLVVSNRKKDELLADLVERGYDLSSKDEDDANDDGVSEQVDVSEDETPDAELAKGYEYLLGMKIWSLTFERAEQLSKQKIDKAEEVKSLEATSPEQIWLTDLDAIEELLDERDKALGIEEKEQMRGKSKANASVAKKRAKRKQDEDEVRSFILDFQIIS